MNEKVAKLRPDIFEIHQTWAGTKSTDGFRNYVTRKGDTDLTEVDIRNDHQEAP